MAQTALVIRVELSDAEDFEWVRNRVVPAVEETVDEIKDEGRLDGTAEVSWEQEDEAETS